VAPRVSAAAVAACRRCSRLAFVLTRDVSCGAGCCGNCCGMAWPGAAVRLACAAVAAMAVLIISSPRCVLLLFPLACSTSSPSSGCLRIHGSVLLLYVCCYCYCMCVAAAMLLLLWLCLCCCSACAAAPSML
jgi:hypothetical protein